MSIMKVFRMDDKPIPPRTNEENLRAMERGEMPWLSGCAIAVFRKMVESPGISLERGAAAYSAVVAYWHLWAGKRSLYSRGQCWRALKELESYGLIELACNGTKFGSSSIRPVMCWRLHGPRPETVEQVLAADEAAQQIRTARPTAPPPRD